MASLQTSMTIAYIGECKTFTCGRIEIMAFATFVIRVLEVMFFVGLVGSAIVVLISFWEDGKELFGKD
ncbi:MAG: hypothetical protein WAL45_08890 [Terracidiphilus sp.]